MKVTATHISALFACLGISASNVVIPTTSCMAAQIADPIAKEGVAPSSIIKMTPEGAKSIRYVTLDYGVSGGKIYLHEYKIGSDASEMHYVDLLTPNGKKLQRFQLAYPPDSVSDEYKIHPMWVKPSLKKIPMILFEGQGSHLVIVFGAGFAKAGSQQFFSELEGKRKRRITFTEIDRKGNRMVRIDIDEPAVGDREALKTTYYYYWTGSTFQEKTR